MTDPESEYGGLVRYWTDDVTSPVPIKQSPYLWLNHRTGDDLSPGFHPYTEYGTLTSVRKTTARRGFIRRIGVIALRVFRIVYRLVWPWR